MKHVVRRLFVFGYALACVIASCAPASAQQVIFSQQIQPLICTVDIVVVGATMTFNLYPDECKHSTAARQLLAKTKAGRYE